MSEARPVLTRFNFEATMLNSAAVYLAARTRQLLHLGWAPGRPLQVLGEWGMEATFTHAEHGPHRAIYVLAQHRGRGLYPRAGLPVLTVDECEIAAWLTHHDVAHRIQSTPVLDSMEYRAITGFYGPRRAWRTGVFLMNHIDEGLYALSLLNATNEALRAYCIHPIVQSHGDLVNAYASGRLRECTADPFVAMLAMEYRSVANEYLSTRPIRCVKEIRLSVLPEVNQMLIADKLQNRKDFKAFHLSTHPRSDQLASYFGNWFERLGISSELWRTFVHGADVGRVLSGAVETE